MGNPARETECVHLIGLCGIDSGRPEMAADQLQRLLKKPGLVKDQALVVRFDLGRALAALGQRDAARAAFQAVMAQDAKFQDVASHLAALDAPDAEPEEAASEDPGFESFDDMLSEISDDDEDEKPDPAGESFEQSEPEPEPEPEPVAAEPEPEPEPEPAPKPTRPAPAPRREPARPPSPSPSGGAKRKKKISFL
jgi:hypothetical protein